MPLEEKTLDNPKITEISISGIQPGMWSPSQPLWAGLWAKWRVVPSPHAAASNWHTFIHCVLEIPLSFPCRGPHPLLKIVEEKALRTRLRSAPNMWTNQRALRVFPGKRLAKTASYAVIGAAYIITRRWLLQVKIWQTMEKECMSVWSSFACLQVCMTLTRTVAKDRDHSLFIKRLFYQTVIFCFVY